ncbi:MAG: zinc dependent phospholipase C family protein [Desulfobacteraceae bacterium]
MLFLKTLFFLFITLLFQLIFTEGAWAWGPAVHTVIACRILEELGLVLPLIAQTVQTFPLEYLYGSLSADFFVGKGQRQKKGHSHNWETGFRLLDEAKDDQETAYAYGFFSHLAADVIAHNYFVPDLVHRISKWKRMGHLYWEAKADYHVGPMYTKIARDVLTMENLGCDALLKSAVRKGRNGLKTKKRIFTQTVKLTDYLCCSQPVAMVNKGSRYQLCPEYLVFMINLSYRLVKDILNHPFSSPSLSYDPIGSRNLQMASGNAILSRLFDIPQPKYQFIVDQELLRI